MALSLDLLRQAREFLDASQNPLFFFDNDVDGLCSFLLLRRALGRGRGVPIKSFPDLKAQYLRKVDELNPDAVIVLDKAEASEEFLQGCKDRHLPILWIDHHESKTASLIDKYCLYLNAVSEGQPTTFVAYSIFERKQDLWLAMIGCTGDAYKPHFAQEFEKSSPELYNANLTPVQALNQTEIGKMVRMLNFGLMDSITNVVQLIKYLFTAKNAYDLLEENAKTKQFHRRYAELNEYFMKQINKARESIDEDDPIIFHSYAGSTSMSSMIANKLSFLYPDKLIVVGFKRQEKVNISLRGKNALSITLAVTKEIQGSTGGGHEVATGAMVPIDEWDKFKELVKEFVEKN